MARPQKSKIISKKPLYTLFTSQNNYQLVIELSLEEYETIRLIDYMGYTQIQCGQQMNISRTSVVSLYQSARKKLARYLIEGGTLSIQGGYYQMQKDKGEYCMKVAVACVNGQIFQHFGHCPSFLLCNIENGKIVATEMLDTTNYGCGMLAGYLKENDVDIVICGNIGGGARNHLSAQGIQVFPGAHGDALLQVESYIEGHLDYDPQVMCEHGNHQCKQEL